ncbi:diacylglycerol kinase [Tenacibaculum sp. M341]|uniref:diacylglycerol kinase n=1 Tax=Tenacibaculum sp. M341 TaxID=2530339 RepID=UPI00104E18B4|nr:diacylglycerol kinase family protein [Tenacibaculum sp. M341]TCI84551.1 diacylglycerol kinase family protein [Tenacibaculum sp. M341]
MGKTKSGFVKRRLKGITYSFKGILILITTEDSIKAQFFIGLFITVFGFIFNISAIEWMIQLTIIGVVLVAEALNTAVEKIADFIHPEYHNKIGVIKDVAAGAAGFAAIISIIIGCIIYIPKIMNLLS